jgi:hypothetical protein
MEKLQERFDRMNGEGEEEAQEPTAPSAGAAFGCDLPPGLQDDSKKEDFDVPTRPPAKQ